MLHHRVEYLDSDQATRIELDVVLNTTETGQRLYAMYWRNPTFFESSSELYDCSLLTMNLLTIVVAGVIFAYQQHRLRQVEALVLVLQTLHVPQVADLKFWILRSTLVPSQSLGKSQGELIIEFSNNYWVMLLGLVILLAVLYKA